MASNNTSLKLRGGNCSINSTMKLAKRLNHTELIHELNKEDADRKEAVKEWKHQKSRQILRESIL
jgi:hypothetical protein